MFELAAARALVESDPDIKGIPEAVQDESSDEARVNPNPNEWQTNDIHEDQRRLWRAVRGEDWGTSGEDAAQARTDYTEAFIDARDKMNEGNDS